MSELKDLGYYRTLPYKRRVDKVPDEREGTYYVCTYSELPGLVADGETRPEAIKNVHEAFDDYIQARLHFGDPIPEPLGAERVTRAIELADQAPKAGALSFAFFFGPPTVSIERHVERRILKSTVKAAIEGQEPATTRADAPTRFREDLVTAGG